jgi:hypothetical protein
MDTLVSHFHIPWNKKLWDVYIYNKENTRFTEYLPLLMTDTAVVINALGPDCLRNKSSRMSRLNQSDKVREMADQQNSENGFTRYCQYARSDPYCIARMSKIPKGTVLAPAGTSPTPPPAATPGGASSSASPLVVPASAAVTPMAVRMRMVRKQVVDGRIQSIRSSEQALLNNVRRFDRFRVARCQSLSEQLVSG